MTQTRQVPLLPFGPASARAVRAGQAAGIDRSGMPGLSFRELAP
jgi:hypothetical protein